MDTKIHCYYPIFLAGSTRQLQIDLNGSTEVRVNATITNNKLKMALNANGICVNGTKLDISAASANFASLVAQKTAQIGSLEGVVRSKATYNEVSIYNRALSEEELIALTRI